jgi:hypothetical protein
MLLLCYCLAHTLSHTVGCNEVGPVLYFRSVSSCAYVHFVYGRNKRGCEYLLFCSSRPEYILCMEELNVHYGLGTNFGSADFNSIQTTLLIS